MFTQFYVLSPRGDTIVFRNFRSEISRSTAESFFRNVRFWNGKPQEAPPVFNVDGIHYMWVKKSGLYFVFNALANVSPCTAIELLVRITKLFKDYCGVLTEESVRANFTLIYELLDEVVDWGYPQSTTTESMRAFVFNEPIQVAKPEPKTIRLPDFGSKTTPSTAVDKPISFKDKDKQRNEIFVDIYERISLTFNSSGNILNQGIDGTIQMKSYLQGNPELRIALNENLVIGRGGGAPSGFGVVELDDCNFHQCVKRNDFEQHKVLSLVPPDGEFVLMNYRITSDFKAPFRIFPFFELTSPHKCELVIKIRADIPETNYGSHVTVMIPMPKSTTSVRTAVGQGQAAEYEEKERTVKWRIKKFQGGTEQTIRCGIVLNSPSTAQVRKEIGPIAMQFEIPMFNTSNLQVKYLRLVDSKHENPYRWVRYITRANAYVCRL